MTDPTAPNLRILRIFEVIADAGRPLTPTEINEQLDWPTQRLHRLCQTLIAEGYLVKQARRLHPTKRLLRLAAGLTQHAAGQTTRHQILQAIARETGETVNFVTSSVTTSYLSPLQRLFINNPPPVVIARIKTPHIAFLFSFL